MPSSATRANLSLNSPSYWALVAFLILLLIAGGASRADAAGQIGVRLAGWVIVCVCVMMVGYPRDPADRRIAIGLCLLAAMPLLQLLPLPPLIWLELPGRQIFGKSAELIDRPQPWRPITLGTGATINALGSLVVPLAVLLLCTRTSMVERVRLANVLIALVLISSFVALLQFAGNPVSNPFINSVPGSVSGTFANRNHLALFIAIGLVLLFGWAFSPGKPRTFQVPIFVAVAVLLLLVTLATGSRMGILLAIVAAALGVASFWTAIKTSASNYSVLTRLLLFTLGTAVLVTAIGASIFLERASGLDRAANLESGEDLRILALPTIFAMIGKYFPIGAGMGTFDLAYRIEEPFPLLGFKYLNHAHNDWVEVVLDGGLVALLLEIGVVAWWSVRSLKVWRRGGAGPALGRVGSAIIFLVFLSSITDYPARTPIIMAVLVISAMWLENDAKSNL